MPWPISADGATMVMAPSVPIVTQPPIVFCAALVAAATGPDIAPRNPGIAKPKANPAEPATKPRRDNCDVVFVVRGHGLALLSGALDRAHDAWIGAAAADVAVHVGDDLLARRLLVLRQQFRRLHDLAGLAVAALRHLLGDPCLLQRMTRIGATGLRWS